MNVLNKWITIRTEKWKVPSDCVVPKLTVEGLPLSFRPIWWVHGPVWWICGARRILLVELLSYTSRGSPRILVLVLSVTSLALVTLLHTCQHHHHHHNQKSEVIWARACQTEKSCFAAVRSLSGSRWIVSRMKRHACRHLKCHCVAILQTAPPPPTNTLQHHTLNFNYSH
jgi:hypothetical protein